RNARANNLAVTDPDAAAGRTAGHQVIEYEALRCILHRTAVDRRAQARPCVVASDDDGGLSLNFTLCAIPQHFPTIVSVAHDQVSLRTFANFRGHHFERLDVARL